MNWETSGNDAGVSNGMQGPAWSESKCADKPLALRRLLISRQTAESRSPGSVRRSIEMVHCDGTMLG